MKGAILEINPKARIVDLTHEIGPQNIREAAFLLLSSYRFFPDGTIHVVVVDPGVGSDRRILCAKTPNAFFIGPDNGVLSPVLNREFSFVLRELKNRQYFRKTVSPTFHGRDKMAPAAAHLSMKNVFRHFGPRLMSLKVAAWPKPRKGKRRIEGEIIHVDRYGNLITNIESFRLSPAEKGKARIKIGKKTVPRIAEYYAEGKNGELLGIINSSEFLEIAAVNSSAAKKTGARVGDPCSVVW
jgi:hypothetical protein